MGLLWDVTPFTPLNPLLVFIFFGPAESSSVEPCKLSSTFFWVYLKTMQLRAGLLFHRMSVCECGLCVECVWCVGVCENVRGV